MRRLGALVAFVAVLAVVALVAVGCGTSAPGTPVASAKTPDATTGATLSTPTAEPTSTPVPSSTAEPTSTPVPSSTAEPTPAPEPTPTLPAIIDRSLLAILPGDVAGSPVTEDVDGEREFGAEPGGSVRRYAAAFVGDTGENIASASIAAVDPADMAGFYPAWRADFDEAACAANDGVATTSTTTIGGRTVETTTCTSGVQLYHVRLRGDSLLVSIMSIGPGEFGKKLIEGLRE